MASALDQLKQHTIVVADTGDFKQLADYRPQDATTNPSLILKAAQKEAYRPLLQHVVSEHKNLSISELVDRVLVRFGMEILSIIPGRVSTEVDARLSFDVPATLAKARHLIGLYEAAGIKRERVLIKLASTWEGIEAARALQADGIRCNMTLLFCLAQAAACAEAGVQLISPFVGRITDWHKKRDGKDFSAEQDPGVLSVREIYAYYKRNGIRTEVMGASFRNIGQVLALAGCDLLTISPELLAQLQASDATVARAIEVSAETSTTKPIERLRLNQAQFRAALNDDAMATEKLAEGIRTFAADAVALERLLSELR